MTLKHYHFKAENNCGGFANGFLTITWDGDLFEERGKVDRTFKACLTLRMNDGKWKIYDYPTFSKMTLANYSKVYHYLTDVKNFVVAELSEMDKWSNDWKVFIVPLIA